MPEKGWALIQTHFKEKRLRLLVASRGVKIEAVIETWGIICAAPDWDAIVYSKADRTICRVPYRVWSTVGFRFINLDDDTVTMPKQRTVSAGTDSIGSYGTLPVVTATWTGSSDSSEDMIFQSRVGPSKCQYKLETSSTIDAPVQVRQLLHQLYHLPPIDRFPLEYSSSLHSRPLLRTVELKRADVPPDSFVPPSGYKKVQTEGDVWVNDQDRDKIKDFGQLLAP